YYTCLYCSCHTVPLYSLAAHRHLLTFPTRRSSDLMDSDGLPVVKAGVTVGSTGVATDDGGYFTLAVTNDSPSYVLTITRSGLAPDRKSTRLNSSHLVISYAVFCLKKKKRILVIETH